MKKVLAVVIDIFLGVIGVGYIIGLISGGSTGSGFSLNGIWFLVYIGAVIAYFVVPKKMWGTSIGKKIVGL